MLVVYIGFIFLSGRISDKFGRKKMLIAAAAGFVVFTIPAFWLLNTLDFFTILVVELIMCLLLTINDGTLSSYLCETFPTDVRYSGFALSFNLANAIFGGSASYISFALIGATGDPIAPAYYMVFIAVSGPGRHGRVARAHRQGPVRGVIASTHIGNATICLMNAARVSSLRAAFPLQW